MLIAYDGATYEVTGLYFDPITQDLRDDLTARGYSYIEDADETKRQDTHFVNEGNNPPTFDARTAFPEPDKAEVQANSTDKVTWTDVPSGTKVDVNEVEQVASLGITGDLEIQPLQPAVYQIDLTHRKYLAQCRFITATYGAAPLTVSPGAGALLLSGAVPTVVVTSDVRVVASGALVLTGGVPTLDFPRAPAAGALLLSGGTPVIQNPSHVSPAAGALLLTGGVPVVQMNTIIKPAAGALYLSSEPPLINIGGPAPAAGELLLTGGTPTLEFSDGPHIGVPPGELTLTGGVPVIEIS